MRLAIMCRSCLSCIHRVSALMVRTNLLPPPGGCSRRVKKRPTVGRRKNLLWVVNAAYRGSVRRPTVGFFRGLWVTSLETVCGAGLRGVGEDAVLCLSEGECKPCLFGRVIGVILWEMISEETGGNTRHGPGANSGFAPGPCRFVGGEGRAMPYIMPPIPPMPGAMAGMAGVSSFFSAMTHSVVRNIPAIDAAFSRATRVTFAGSMTPET